MGAVASCLKPQPRYPVIAAPPLKRRQVKKSEISRPPTKRFETLQERAKELDHVGTPAETLPTLLTPTPSAIQWVQLEGTFSLDQPHPQKPLSQKLVDKFKKQDEECKTLEKQLAEQLADEADGSQHDSLADLAEKERIAREALEASDDEGDEDCEAEQDKGSKLRQIEDRSSSVQPPTSQPDQDILFQEVLNLKEDEGAKQSTGKQGGKATSVSGQIDRFDALGRDTNVRDDLKAKNNATESADDTICTDQTRSVTFKLPAFSSHGISQTDPTVESHVTRGNDKQDRNQAPMKGDPTKESPRVLSAMVVN